MAFVVLYDACVLYPAAVRDLLIRVANAGIVQGRWTERILDETFRNIAEQRPDLSPDNLARTRHLMTRAVPDCLVTDYESLEASLVLPDPDDRHVLAAAIRAGAQVIVTTNLRDFPEAALAPYDIEAKHPDDFILDSIDIAPGAVIECLVRQAAALRQPPQTPGEVVDTLRDAGLVRSAARLRELLAVG